MPDIWVGLDTGIDPISWARLLRRAYERSIADGRSPSGIIRPIIAASWQRSQRLQVNTGERAPVMLEPAEVVRRLRAHPIAALLPVIRTSLVPVAESAHQVVVVADHEGHILWISGHPEACKAAHRINLVPGALWSETVCGTNAIGLAIVLDHPVQVFSAEHFKPMLHGWSCAAAPIHNSESAQRLAVVALAGSFKRAHRHGLSLVAAAAQIAEAHLQHHAAQRDERLKVEYLEQVLVGCGEASAVVNPLGRVLLSTPPGWLGGRLQLSADGVPIPPSSDEVAIERMRGGEGFLVVRKGAEHAHGQRPTLWIEALGRDRATGRLGRRSFEFTPRHSEILVILAQHPQGLSEDDLAIALYGSSVKSVTLRAEISRLRRLLGPVIMTRPYRVAAHVRADFMELLSAAEQGVGVEAMTTPPGRLLPSSTAPGVVQMRMRLERAIATPPSVDCQTLDEAERPCGKARRQAAAISRASG
jgi:hypothetical protein